MTSEVEFKVVWENGSDGSKIQVRPSPDDELGDE